MGVVASAKPPVILVVEDEPLIRLAVVGNLVSLGYAVLEAGDAEAAIAILMKHSVDMVFSDVQMPGAMDGYELAEWLEINFPSVAVLLTSGRSLDRGHGAAALLRKPYDFEALQNRVDLVLMSTGKQTAAPLR